MKGLFCCSLNCTHMQTKRLMIGSTLTVHNCSQPPSNSPWTCETPKWGLLPRQHPLFVCPPLCAGQQSPGSQTSSIRNEERGYSLPPVDGVYDVYHTAWWQPFGATPSNLDSCWGKQTLFFKSLQITDSVENFVVIKFFFCSIHFIKKLEDQLLYPLHIVKTLLQNYGCSEP